MRALFLLLSVLLAACLVCSTPINPKRWLINRPSEEYQRARRSPQYTKGGDSNIKGRVQLTRMQLNLRKGEYVCGNKVCKLQPGDVPKHCKDNICQYPIGLTVRK